MSPPSPPPGAGLDLAGYHVVTAVCGGIAAYKVCQVVSALAQRGAEVTVAMTRAARRFVGPATFAALSGRPVLTSIFKGEAHDPQHIRLTEGLDVLLVAPATYNIIGKVACGLADEVVSTLVAAANAPVILAPAMNTRMWENPICRGNIARLEEAGYHIIPPGEGWLACRTIGTGRMAEPEEILRVVCAQLAAHPPKSA